MSGQEGGSAVEDQLSEGLRTVLQDVVTACDTQFERVAHSQAALSTRLDALETKLSVFRAKVGAAASTKAGAKGEASPSDSTIFEDYANKVSAIRGRVDGVNRRVDAMRKRVRAVEDIVKTKRSLAETVIASAVQAERREAEPGVEQGKEAETPEQVEHQKEGAGAKASKAEA